MGNIVTCVQLTVYVWTLMVLGCSYTTHLSLFINSSDAEMVNTDKAYTVALFIVCMWLYHLSLKIIQIQEQWNMCQLS